VRDTARAVELAERACELTEWQQAGPLRTLAVARAVTGRPDDALELFGRALDAARSAGQGQLAAEIERERAWLESTRGQAPTRESPARAPR
jgi:hypothetical protein